MSQWVDRAGDLQVMDAAMGGDYIDMGSEHSSAAMGRAMRLLGGDRASAEARLQQAAWVARCVGRGASAPLTPDDITALASTLRNRSLSNGTVAFQVGEAGAGVWIVRSGRLELSVRSGLHRVVVRILHPGDVDGDIQHLLDMPPPYTARALGDTECLYLAPDGFERLLAGHASIARRWLSSVAQRVSSSQDRILGMLGRSLAQQTARLLLEEAADGVVELSQQTLAAMLGVRRPSLNKVLKEFERDKVIAVRYGAVEIHDAGKLADKAA